MNLPKGLYEQLITRGLASVLDSLNSDVINREALDPVDSHGPADYVSHEKERPIAFVWRLRRPMPADFFKEAKVAAG